MANEIVPWDVEEVPEPDILFMRIHRSWFSNGVLNTAAFRNTPTAVDGMSTDWNKYSSALDTRRRSQRNHPVDYAVVQMEVGQVKRLPGQSVVHSPEADNRAHTDVFGDKLPEVRVKLGRLVDQAGYVYSVDDPDE